MKGWTKMDEGSWRHDGYDHYNKLNIYTLENPSANLTRDKTGDHISEMRKHQRPSHGYVITYTDNGFGGGTKIVEKASSKTKAKKKANKIMRSHPSSKV